MNTTRWIKHFQQNRLHRPEPHWDVPITLDLHTISRVLPSLEGFQLGDGGGPASLIAGDAQRFRESSADMRTIVDSWFAEEKEHSRLLSCAVRRFGGKLIKSHWSFTAFCACRRIFGVWFELQVLLLTELVSTAYYRVLRRHIEDAPVRDMCTLILRDEAGHVAFHRERLAAAAKGPGLLAIVVWALQFWMCGVGAATMLWLNHRGCLTAIGGTRTEYYREVGLEISRFVRRLFNPAQIPQDGVRARMPAPALTH
ncbi:MAG TPA: ferritin-like domain-containing protein [Verrucomicrobiae bacterium]|nr:ferritin-like domain-containing protein [Verrucomicrobiae bacterium]